MRNAQRAGMLYACKGAGVLSLFLPLSLSLTGEEDVCEQGILKGDYNCTVDLLFDWFGLVCFANENKNCQ